jgi:CheY-like chemotaxis protein
MIALAGGLVMPYIVVVDDVAVDRALLCGVLGAIPGAEIRGVAGGREALELLAKAPVNLLVTDLLMPEMDGLELTMLARQRRPEVPVILTTSLGDETIGEQALRAGASDFVPKSRAAQWLVPVATAILAVATRDRLSPRLIDHLASVQFSFALGNSLEMVSGAADLVRDMVVGLWQCDDTEKIRLGVILEHALTYAILHSNLELNDTDLEGCDPWTLRTASHPLIAQRLGSRPFTDRGLQLNASVTREEARFALRTDGRRLLPQQASAPGSWCDMSSPLSRTLLMMSLLLDETTLDDETNELVLVRRRDGSASRAAA